MKFQKMDADFRYLDMLRYIQANGIKKEDRTGTGTISVFGYQARYDLTQGLPVLTTKKIHLKSVIHELIWMLKGETNIKYLKENGVSIWHEWADESGELGPVYGKQWRAWAGAEGKTMDQIQWVIDEIKRNPDSRRLCVSAWNATEISSLKLPPCHAFFQFCVTNGRLSCQLYQRSADAFLGVPFNMASYAILTHLVAHECGLEVGEFIHTFGDLHIYLNHLEQVNEQLRRHGQGSPTLKLNPDVKRVLDFRFEDIEVENYNPLPAIKAPVSV